MFIFVSKRYNCVLYMDIYITSLSCQAYAALHTEKPDNLCNSELAGKVKWYRQLHISDISRLTLFHKFHNYCYAVFQVDAAILNSLTLSNLK